MTGVPTLEDLGERLGGYDGRRVLVRADFNVPLADENHARRAVECASEILHTVGSSTFGGESIGVRVGINTGSLVAGNVGGGGRQNYTVHGDAVNRAARLESLNKEYGTRLLVSATSIARIDDVEFVEVGETAVRGQTEAIKLYTLKSAKADVQSRS